MPRRITAYRVFIASPGGLEAERETFRATLNEYNEADAIERGVVFLPVGWEMTPGGIGRPQQTINEEVRRSDYFALVLHDHWGSAPQVAPGPFTSGSEEEFSVAQECHANGTLREILVFFKTVDKGKMADPGDALRPVLDFKTKLETEKSLLFETFDLREAFVARLQRQLARWVRDHEKGEGGERDDAAVPRPAKSQATTEGPIDTPVDIPIASDSPAIQQAVALAEQGQVTQAEQAFVQVINAVGKPQVDDATLEAWIRYGGLLFQQKNLAKAQEVFEELQGLAHAQGKVDWEVAALNAVASVYVEVGEPERAEASYRQVIAIQEQALGSNSQEIAAGLNNLAELLRHQFRFGEAESLLRRALDIQGIPLET